MKKTICMLLCAMLLAAPAAALGEIGGLTAKSAILCDASGTVLYEMNADAPLQPASVTKIMTMLLIMEAVDSGQAAWEDPVTGSSYAASMGGTQIWLKEGEQLSLDEMMKAIAVGSANDCAVAVAEHLAGSEDAFTEKMNERAEALGCTNTVFVNANGLDLNGEKTLTSARDIAKISCELLRHPDILRYTMIWMDTIRNGQFTLANTNKMLRQYDGLIGLKTGYISEAGFCISAAAERDAMQLIAVVMGAPTKEDRMRDASQLLDYGFANYVRYHPDLSGIPQSVAVKNGKQDAVRLVIGDCGELVVEKGRENELEIRVDLPSALQAPVERGCEIGSVSVCDGETVLCKIPICTAEPVGKMTFLNCFVRLLQELGAGTSAEDL